MTDIDDERPIRPIDSDYQFAAEPKVVRQKRKYRQDDKAPNRQKKYRYQNLMFEKRVVRGNTYSSYMVAQTELEDAAAMQAEQKRHMRQNQRHQQEDPDMDYHQQQQEMGATGPLAPKGCKNKEAYTDAGVETETDLPPCHDATTQTEWVIEKKLPDLSMPVYTGIHKETQIYANEGLFDFDYEAEPIVQVIVTRVLEESQIEVVEEEELKVLKRRQRHLKKINDREEEEKRAIEQVEQEKETKNLNRNSKLRKKKALMIDTHKHMISRVYSKRFLSGVQDTAFEILENMCMFLDEEAKGIKDAFLPWLYAETLSNIKSSYGHSVGVEAMAKNVEGGILATHRHSVFSEMERRRLEAEEKQRQIDERNDRRARKLAYKLKRREDRRLYHIHNDIIEKFIDKGEDDNLTVNICEFDGSDAGGNRGVGFRGGVIGELFLFLQQLLKEERFQNLNLYEHGMLEDLWEGLFNGGFIQDGWTVMVGLRLEFEKNYQNEIDDEWDFSQFNLGNLRTIDNEEMYRKVVDFVVEHYMSTYFYSIFPGMRERQSKALEKYKVEEEPEGGQEEAGEEENGDGEEEVDQDEDEENELNKGAEKQEVPGDGAVEGEGEQTNEEVVEEGPHDWDELVKFVKAILLRTLDRNSSIRGINFKFNLTEEFVPEPTDPEGAEEGEEEEDEDPEPQDGPIDNMKPYGLCLMIPEPIKEEEEGEEEQDKVPEGSELNANDNPDLIKEEENEDESEGEGGEENQADKNLTPEETVDPDYQKGGRFEFRKPGEEYLKPYEPEGEFFDQEFGDEILQLEHILPDVRIQSIHYPLLTKFRAYVLDQVLRMQRVEIIEEENEDLLLKVNKETVAEIRQYAKDREEIDLIYVNSQ